MIDLNAETHRAGEARQILDSAMFQAARAHLEEQLAAARQAVPIRDTDMHTRLILMEQMFKNLIGYFEQIAQTGRMAEIQLRQEEERKSLLDRGLAMFRQSGRV